MIHYTEEQRQQISKEAEGKIVQSMEWEEYSPNNGYWVMTFEDGSEISFRLMAELC